jgi:hypothetical protein
VILSNRTIVFLSYVASDAAFVERLKSDLVAQGLCIQTNAMQSNEEALFATIDLCDIFLMILSPEALQAPEIARDLNRADMSGKAIIPLIAVPCALPMGMAQKQALMFTGDYERAFPDLMQAIERQVRGGISPRIGIPVLVVLFLVVTAVFWFQQRFPFWEIVLSTATLAALAKNLASWLGEKAAGVLGHFMTFLGQSFSMSMLFLAGFLNWTVSTPRSRFPDAFGIGAFAGLGVGLVLMLELVLTGTYKSNILHRRIQRFVEFLDYFTQLAKIFGIVAETFLWLIGGAIAGGVGALLAQRLFSA